MDLKPYQVTLFQHILNYMYNKYTFDFLKQIDFLGGNYLLLDEGDINARVIITKLQKSLSRRFV